MEREKFDYMDILKEDFIDNIIVEELKRAYDYAAEDGDLELGAGARSVIRFYTTQAEFDEWDHSRVPIVLQDIDFGN